MQSLPGKVLHGLSLWWEKLRGDKTSPHFSSPAFAFSLFTVLLGLISSRATNYQDRLLPTWSWKVTAPQPGSGGICVSGCSPEMQTLPGFVPLLQGWGSPAQLCCGEARAVPVALAVLPGIYTRAHQRQPQHRGSAPWLSVKPPNAPGKPSANTDTRAAVALRCCFSPGVALKSIIVHILLFQ